MMLGTLLCRPAWVHLTSISKWLSALWGAVREECIVGVSLLKYLGAMPSCEWCACASVVRAAPWRRLAADTVSGRNRRQFAEDIRQRTRANTSSACGCACEWVPVLLTRAGRAGQPPTCGTWCATLCRRSRRTASASGAVSSLARMLTSSSWWSACSMKEINWWIPLGKRKRGWGKPRSNWQKSRRSVILYSDRSLLTCLRLVISVGCEGVPRVINCPLQLGQPPCFNLEML